MDIDGETDTGTVLAPQGTRGARAPHHGKARSHPHIHPHAPAPLALGATPCSVHGTAPSVALTLLGHAHFEALLQPAVLATVPGHLVDDAVLVPVTRVHHVLLDAAAEEALGTESREAGQPHPQSSSAGP